MTGVLPPDGVAYNVDQWDGYTADRRELVDFLADRGVTNTVFLTGDIHSAWACELPVDPGTYPLSRTVGVELVATSVTSNNLDDLTGSPPRTTSVAVGDAIKASNRHVKYLDFDSHGYSVLTITPQETQMDWYVTSDRADPAATSTWSTAGGGRRPQQAHRGDRERPDDPPRPVCRETAPPRAAPSCGRPEPSAAWSCSRQRPVRRWPPQRGRAPRVRARHGRLPPRRGDGPT